MDVNILSKSNFARQYELIERESSNRKAQKMEVNFARQYELIERESSNRKAQKVEVRKECIG
jgi:hypothetical protein